MAGQIESKIEDRQTPIRAYADTPTRFSPRRYAPSRQVTLISSRLSADTQWTQVASRFLVSKPMKFGSGGRIVAKGVWRQLKHHERPTRWEKAFSVPPV